MITGENLQLTFTFQTVLQYDGKFDFTPSMDMVNIMMGYQAPMINYI